MRHFLFILLLVWVQAARNLIDSLQSQMKAMIQQKHQAAQEFKQRLAAPPPAQDKIEDVEEVTAGQSIIENVVTKTLTANDLTVGDSLQMSEGLLRLKHSSNIVVGPSVYPVDFIGENMVAFLKGIHHKCSADLSGCMLRDWDNIDISMVSDLDVVQLQQADSLPNGMPPIQGMEGKRQQIAQQFKELKEYLVANGASEYVRSIENSNDIVQVMKQMQTVKNTIEAGKVKTKKLKQVNEEQSIEQEVNQLLN